MKRKKIDYPSETKPEETPKMPELKEEPKPQAPEPPKVIIDECKQI